MTVAWKCTKTGRRMFICDGCGVTFNSTSKPEEVKKEAEQNYPEGIPTEDEATICDGCYKTFMAWKLEQRKHPPMCDCAQCYQYGMNT